MKPLVLALCASVAALSAPLHAAAVAPSSSGGAAVVSTVALASAASMTSGASTGSAEGGGPGPAGASPAASVPAQRSKMKTCNVAAQGKHGDERRAFMKQCLSKKPASAPVAS